MFAALQDSDEYNLMKNGFAPVLQEINALITEKVITVNGEVYEIDFISWWRLQGTSH